MAALSLRSLMLASLLLGLSSGCSGALDEPDDGTGRRDLLFTFDSGTQDWTGNFTDLASSQVNDVGFLVERRALPTETGLPGGALFVSGRNPSDDLFMFITTPVTGLLPSTPYAVTFELELVSNGPTGCVGVGGSPGESVFVKAGAAPVQPDRVLDSRGHYALNVDKGNQASEGANAVMVGDIANGSTDCTNPPYRPITRDNRSRPLRVTSDAQGTLWLFVGTDSGYESTTSLYYDTIRVVLEPAAQ
ncbi:hypothetical protein [Hyalangium minutum]|uniref:Lipoprotein n=1 Tax=Hyalangium minutum TaxID=394096 RepID=A0A085WKA0_9BACT|nr:hypothetical protein [Hyalangium minutum]KFE68113.1 hypothetical protein DB31_7350 [Hyalangium minutum]